MMLKRYHTIYPQNIFRAQIIFKNVAPSEDKWAEGVLCRDIEGRFSIVNRKVGHGEYALDSVYIDTLGLASGFKDGNEKDIFEGDIIRRQMLYRQRRYRNFFPSEDSSFTQYDRCRNLQ